MLVNNVSGRMLVIPETKEDTVNGTAFKKVVDKIVLFPGWNECKLGFYDNAKDIIHNLIDTKQVVMYGQPNRDTGDYEDKLLSTARSDMARDVVEGCVNPLNIREWQKDAKLSTELRSLADMQMKKIQAGGDVEE